VLVEERQEAAINGRRSQNSERLRAHLYEREFRAKPVSCVNAHMNAGATGVRIVRRTRQCHGHARFLRTNVTCIWGVSDQVQLDHGAKKGAWQAGSLTPQMPPSPAADSRTDCDTGGTKRRRRAYSKSHVANDFAELTRLETR